MVEISLPENLKAVWMSLGSGSLVFIVGMAIRKILLIRLNKWSQTTETKIDDIVVGAIRVPMILWCVVLSVYVALKVAAVPDQMGLIMEKSLQVLWLASLTLVAAQILSQLMRVFSRKFESTMPVTTLTENIVRIIVWCMGGLMILQSLGISIAPILATLGIGGLAVALALQDTLANLFSGFHIIMARQIKVGDFVKLETGQEGYIIDMNWRTTKIRMLPNNVVLIPNAKLAQAVVTNYYLPEKEMAVLVEVGVHYDSDLRRVERVTCDVAKEVMREVQGGVKAFEPFIRCHTFADFSINFTVILRCQEFVDQYLLKHEFICRLHERYKKEGIVIPYPIRAINYDQEKVLVGRGI
ncbi:MAG: mechanosensitive ion channel family protein [Candidatus Omnitrophica bacterium]|nr:mechanosensitive ion channel family protein [Candidatus Omnitrophota bacterium]